MVKGTFKQIDLLRKRRDSNFLLDPYFIDNRKYIKKGLLKGLSLIIISLIIGIPFIFRTKFLDNKKEKIKPYSDEYDLLVKNLDKEQKKLKEIAKFNKDLKNSIINISSSSALFQEIALIIPKEVQLLDFISKENSLVLKTKLSNEEYLETINSFLIMLDNSELIKFEDIDLKEIKVSNDKSKNKSYLVNIETKISNNYSEINDKYLIKLGSYGLFNRLNILKNIDESSD
ncbi:PilN domain-containing protein [Prochlorococcus sp. AH-716-D22]|nr:PilN domain-containing protein [Prochlorococcus sp. AH-716-D22]